MSDQALIPPRNLESERSLCGMLLLERTAIEKAMPLLRPDDCYWEKHRRIVECAYEMYNAGEPVDIVSLSTWLQKKGYMETIGGTAYLVEIARNCSPLVASHIREIVTCAQRRELIRGASSLIEECYLGQRDPGEMISAHDAVIENIRNRGHVAQQDGIGVWAFREMSRMEEEHEQGEPAGIRCGIESINNILDPILPGELCIIAGLPSMGKTTFAMANFAIAAAKLGKRVLVLSLEMRERALAFRAMSALAPGVESWELKQYHYRKQHWGRLSTPMEDTVNTMMRWDMPVVFAPEMNPRELLAHGKQKQANGGLDLIVIDGLWLMTDDNRHSSRVHEVSSIVRRVKAHAGRLNVPIIMLHQLNRAAAQREEKRPILQDLRESGEVEQTADQVLFLHRPHYFDKKADERVAEVIVAKQRNGATNVVTIHADLKKFQFADIAGEQSAPRQYRED